MKETTNQRITNAKEVSKESLINKIKESDPAKFNQMLIGNEERKTYYYVNYKASAYSREVKKIEFPLFKDLVGDFERNIELHGSQPEILNDNSLIQKAISKGYTPKNAPKYSAQKLVFSELKLELENNHVTQNQPTYYIPNESERHDCKTCHGEKYTTCTEHECRGKHIYDCNKCHAHGELDCSECDGRGEYTCPSCHGDGHLTCSFCKGSGIDQKSDSRFAKCKQCNGSGKRKCSSYNYGKGSGLLGVAVSGVSAGVKKAAGNEYCGGSGIIRCKTCSSTGKITCDKCNGNRQIECNVCYGDHTDNRYGKVNCDTCKTAGEIVSISYIETTIKENSEELILTNGKEIKVPGFDAHTIKNFVDIKSPKRTYESINGEEQEFYDEHSRFCSDNILPKTGNLKDNYPKLITEEIFYEGVPCSTFNYNHILSASFHDVSVLSIDRDKQVLFHSNPEAVAQAPESFGDKLKELLGKAFSTKSYKDKIDRKNELFLMVHMAKADGIIEEEEKEYLSKIITGLHGFTQKEKIEIFNLMSSNELPDITPDKAFFSSLERAEEAKRKIVEMVAYADGEYEPEEKAKMVEIENAIELGFKEKPSAVSQFFKTWQISVSLILLFILLTVGIVWMIIREPSGQNFYNTELIESNEIDDNDDMFDDSEILSSEDDLNTQDYYEQTYTISDPDGYSNLRQSPNGQIITKVNEGQEFYVITEEDGWKKVELLDGTQGYIHSSRVVENNQAQGEITKTVTLLDGFDADGSLILMFSDEKGNNIQIESFEPHILDKYVDEDEYGYPYIKEKFLNKKYKITYIIKQITSAEMIENGMEDGYEGPHLLKID